MSLLRRLGAWRCSRLWVYDPLTGYMQMGVFLIPVTDLVGGIIDRVGHRLKVPEYVPTGRLLYGWIDRSSFAPFVGAKHLGCVWRRSGQVSYEKQSHHRSQDP